MDMKIFFIQFMLFGLIVFVNSVTYASECLTFLTTKTSDVSFSIDLLGNNGLAKSYIELAQTNKLIRQDDQVLVEEKMSFPNGDISGPLSLLNIYYAKENLVSPRTLQQKLKLYAFKLLDFFENYVYRSTEILNQRIHDPRYGTDLDVYLSQQNFSVTILGLDTFAVAMTPDNFHFTFLREDNGLLVASFTSGLTNLQKPIKDSAIVILAVDTYNKKMIISDPNQPQRLSSVSYTLKNGKLFINQESKSGSFVEITDLYYVTLLKAGA